MSLSVTSSVASSDNLLTLERMLESVSFADEIVVHAMFEPNKELIAICSQHNVEIIKVGQIPKVVESIRNTQIHQTKNDWVLVLDFDEVVTPELKLEIENILSVNQPGTYALSRLNFSLGRPLRHGGWDNDYVVRLLHKSLFKTWPTNIHSVPKVEGEITKLKGYLEHYKDESLSYIVNKTNRYSEVEAELFFKGNLPPVTSLTFIRKSVMEFIRRYFLKLGFLDGKIGLIQSIYQSYSVFITYAKLFEMQQHPDNPEPAISTEPVERVEGLYEFQQKKS